MKHIIKHKSNFIPQVHRFPFKQEQHADCQGAEHLCPHLAAKVLLLAAVGLRFREELHSRALHRTMASAVAACASVLRSGGATLVDVRDVVPGDIVRLSAGDLIPGDVRILDSRSLFVRSAPEQS